MGHPGSSKELTFCRTFRERDSGARIIDVIRNLLSFIIIVVHSDKLTIHSNTLIIIFAICCLLTLL